MKTCPTCHRLTDAASEGIVQAVIATRPHAGPAQARHIARLEAALAEAQAWIAAKCTIKGCWKSKYEALLVSTGKGTG